MQIKNINETVLEALDFMEENKPPTFNIDDIGMTFVVGSGNAINTGKILFSGKAAIFCDESSFKPTLKAYKNIMDSGEIKEVVIISASGEKDSVWEAEEAKKHGLHTTLLTCEKDSTAASIADKVCAFRKIAEPYTYNFSTYVGMMLSVFQESPKEIQSYIESLQLPENFSQYEGYSFILPDKYLHVCPMIEIKRNELFGPHLPLRAFTFGHARHAGFVHPWEKELVITFGEENKHFGHPDHRLDINIPDSTNFATIVSLSYYLVGKIQEGKTPYFKQNIENWCKVDGPKAYGGDQVFDVIVPGN